MTGWSWIFKGPEVVDGRFRAGPRPGARLAFAPGRSYVSRIRWPCPARAPAKIKNANANRNGRTETP